MIIDTGGRGLYNEASLARELLEETFNMCVDYMNDEVYGFGVITLDEAGMHIDMYSADNELMYTYTRPPADDDFFTF